ncbi:unnamed protein product [Discula destructiva]
MFGHTTPLVSGSSPPLYDCYRLNNITQDSGSSSLAARSIPSGRKGSKKVRTGCVTCKIRKVKCDETKPFCLRCTKTGRQCDGYLDPRALRSKRRSVKDAVPLNHALSTLLSFATPDEKRALCFFQQYTAPCISGDFDAVFWRTIVLQICQAEPAVRHAVLAVSSLHEGLSGTTAFIDGSQIRPQQSFALLQYNKAIACLLDQMSSSLTKPLASVLTCILFVCIEYMQGKDKESLIHLEQGRQLLAQLDMRFNDPEVDCIVQHIVPLYTRLSLTSFIFGGSPVPIPESLKPQIDIPVTFDTVENMRHSMHDFMEQAFRFTQRARPVKNPGNSVSRETMGLLEVERDRLLARLAMLNVAFSLFRASRSDMGPENALLVLQMYLHAQHIWISTALSSREVVYDNFLSSFIAIVPLAAAYLDLESSSQHRTVLPPQSSHYTAAREQISVAYTSSFTFETHIIPPLYYVATKCRHPLIQRSALDLLKRNPFRRENLWRASVMGALAGHIVALEERRSLAQKPSQIIHPHTQSHAMSLYSTSTQTDKSLAAITTSSSSMPTLNSEAPTSSILLPRVEDASSISHPPSMTISADDEYFSGPMMKPTTAFVHSLNNSDTWRWQQQQQQQQQKQQQHSFQQYDGFRAVDQTSYIASASYDTPQSQRYWHAGHVSVDNSSHSESSEISSVDFEEQCRYQAMVRGHSPPTQYQSQQQQQQQQIRSYEQPGHTQEASKETAPSRQRAPVPSHLTMEAPFGLPEELRVHDAMIGPEREDGTWVAVFRKLHGVHAECDMQNDWASTV